MSPKDRTDRGTILAYNAAEKMLNPDNIAPIYLLAGRKLWADGYLRDRFIRKVKDQFLGEEESEMTTEIYRVGADKPEKIINALATSNLFSDKKLVIVHDVQKLTTDALTKLGQYASSPIHENCVILISLNFDARRKWYTSIKNAVVGVKIETPFDNQIGLWISEFARSRGKKISRDATILLSEYAGNSLQLLDMEMEKLSIFVDDKETIEENDVKGAIGFSRELSPLDLEKYLAGRDLYWTLRSVEDMIDRGENAPSIAIYFFNFLMNTLTRKEEKNKPAGKWSPREEIRKDAARRWSRDELIRGIELVKGADFKLKQTSVPNKVIFSELAVQLLDNESAAGA